MPGALARAPRKGKPPIDSRRVGRDWNQRGKAVHFTPTFQISVCAEPTLLCGQLFWVSPVGPTGESPSNSMGPTILMGNL